MTDYAFRDVEPGDAPFLLEMLRLTVAWHLVPAADGSPPPILVPPHAFDDLGRPGDGGVTVTYDDEPVGACWYRLNLTAREYEGRPVPEMSVAVMPAHRAHGIGGQLLDRAIEHARARRPPGDRPRRRARQPRPRDVRAPRLRPARRHAGRPGHAQDPAGASSLQSELFGHETSRLKHQEQPTATLDERDRRGRARRARPSDADAEDRDEHPIGASA